jgi:hypothetical protein
VPGCQLGDQLAVSDCRRTRRYNKATVWRTREVSDAALNFARIARTERAHLDTERGRHGLDSGELAGSRYRHITQDCGARDAGRDFLEQLEPFAAHAVFELRKPGNVSSRACKAVDETGTDRINHACEYNWHCVSCLLQWPHGGGVTGQNDIG